MGRSDRAQLALQPLFAPRSIAIIGASADPTSIGARPLRMLRQHGYPGALYPVNPRHTELSGLPTYPTIAVPARVDLAAQQERWLRPICEGRMRCAIAMTEPEAGSAATEMAIGLNAARATLYAAAASERDGDLDPLQVSMAKVFVAETCVRICDMAIQLFGGYGFMADAPVNQRYRRVRGTAIYGGTMQIHRNMIAARILGRRNNQRAR